jgi:hypothetical protein
MPHYLHKRHTKQDISDTVFFKIKFIIQPTLTPTNTIVNAITGLTNALKVMRNIKGIQNIERLRLLDKLLNNIPKKLTETLETTEPRVKNIQPTQREEVESTYPKPMSEETSIILTPAPRVQDKEKETQEMNRL